MNWYLLPFLMKDGLYPGSKVTPIGGAFILSVGVSSSSMTSSNSLQTSLISLGHSMGGQGVGEGGIFLTAVPDQDDVRARLISSLGWWAFLA